jgi:cell division protein FtsW
MGGRAVTDTALTAAPAQPLAGRRSWTLGFDAWLLLLVAVMIAFGLVMVYSASWDVSYRLYQDSAAIFRRQLGNLAFAMTAMIVAAWIPLRWLRRLALPIMGASVLLLIAALVLSAGGAPRRAILGGSVQPSEMATLALIIYLAVWMESKGDRLSEWGYGFLPLVMILGVVDGLVLLQPDLSVVLTAAIVALAMFYLAGAKASQSLFITLGGGVVGYLLVRVTTTGRERWGEYLAGLIDVDKASYHVQQSLEAFYSGGLIGRGLGASREKFGLLPAPHTDSIFAVTGEELGLIGALFVLVLFCLFLWRGFRVASQSPERLAQLLAAGITFYIGVQAMVNMAVLLGLLPFAGNALPFFSYGGSNLTSTLVGVGFLLNVSRRKPVEVGLPDHVSIVGVGWRHRRRRVSRLSHRRRARIEG